MSVKLSSCQIQIHSVVRLGLSAG